MRRAAVPRLTAAEKNYAVLHAAVVAACARGAPLDDVGAVVHRARASGYATRHYKTAWNNYMKACHNVTAPFPLTVGKLTGFAAWYVAARGNSSANLPNVISNLKMTCVARGIAWLTHADAVVLTGNVDALAKAFPQGAGQRAALLLRDIAIIKRALDVMVRTRPERGLWAAQMWAMLAVAHAAMLRPNEYVDGRLTIQDVRYLRPGVGHPHGAFQLCIVRGKSDKASLRGMQALVKGTGSPLCGVQALSRYMALLRMRPGRGAHALFPRLDSGGHVVAANYTAAQWRDTVKLLAGLGALPAPNRFTARSLRYGGCIDLLLRGNPPEVVMRLGRWRSLEMVDLYSLQMGVGVLGMMR
jgi:hypothetical protein